MLKNIFFNNLGLKLLSVLLAILLWILARGWFGQ